MSGVTLNLNKGDRVEIPELKDGLTTKVTAGMGWDAGADFDLDIIAIHLKDGKLHGGATGVAYYGNKSIPGIQLSEDNRTGEGEGDDEFAMIDLENIPADVDAVMLGANIYRAAEKGQSFGQVNNAFIRLYKTGENTVNLKTSEGKEVRFDLSEDFSGFTAVLAAKLYRKDGTWKFQALGEGRTGTVQDIANSFA